MIQLALFVLAVAAVVVAAPVEQELHQQQQQQQHVAILRQSFDGPSPDGSYSYGYETADGTQVQQEGYIKNAGTDDEALQVQGSYSYTSDDGTPIQVSYIANENGFQPQGEHLPGIPPLIQRSLEYNAAHPEEDGIDAHSN